MADTPDPDGNKGHIYSGHLKWRRYRLMEPVRTKKVLRIDGSWHSGRKSIQGVQALAAVMLVNLWLACAGRVA
jgi:hypothetical protein